MLTITLAVMHAISKNESFQPEVLYFGTFTLDLAILDALFKVL